MIRKYIIEAEDSIKGFDEEIAKLEREWGAEEIEPCEDAISRQEVISEIDRYIEKAQSTGTRDDFISFQELVVKQLPSVTPMQTNWIPVSERLPEENIHVLCQFYMGGMAECYHAHGMWHIVGGLRISCDEVIAWMPLPEPYKEDSNGE